MMIRRIIVWVFCLCILNNGYGQIGIGTTNPDPSAIVEVNSSDKGLLIPRLTSTQRDLINLPAEGLMIYNITTNCIEVNSGTSASPDWNCVTGTSSVSFSNDCDVNGFEGSYYNGAALSSSNKFSLTVTNTGSISSTLSFVTGDLTLSGVTGVSVSSVSPSSVTLAAGASQLIEYSLSGTPGSTGTLQGDWASIGLSCTKTVSVAAGDATFTLPQTAIVFSVSDGVPLIDVQGVVDNAVNQFTVEIPYTSGVGSYNAYTGVYVSNNPGTAEGGDANSFRLTYPSGVFSSSGTITATIEVDGDGSFNAEKQLFGIQETIASLDFQVNGVSKGNVNLDVSGGIPDRAFANPNHRFIYLPVMAKDGNVWLNHNLGAQYTNANHVAFDPSQQATSILDFNAYGSLYQWGRGSDDHELVLYITSSIANPANPTDPTLSATDAPGNPFFITSPSSPFDWRTPQNPILWQGETGTNNPCPVGYRVPTAVEWTNLIAAEGISNSSNAASSTLALTPGGNRFRDNGNIVSLPTTGNYWSSTASGTFTTFLYLDLSTTTMGLGDRANGLNVRCIQD